MANNSKKRKKLELKTLKPKKHDQLDFFIADNFDIISFRDEIVSMEHPLFALKAGDTKDREYVSGNTTILIKPNSAGLATIFDKDVWIYAISKLQQAIYEGKNPSPKVRFTVYDFLITTNRSTGGIAYRDFTKTLERLKGTTITTNLYVDDDNEEFSTFGLIDSSKAIKTKKNTKEITEVEITIPNWLFEQIAENRVLKISPDYFRIRKAIDRRIYEIARKHCGNQKEFKISLDLLYKKSGSSASKEKFKFNIKTLAKTNDLPDYEIFYENKLGDVTFKRRLETIIDNEKLLVKLEAKQKRELIEQTQFNTISNNQTMKQSVTNILNFLDHNFPDKKYPIFQTEILTKKKLTEYLRLFEADYLLQKIIEFIDYDFTKECKNPEAYFYGALKAKKR